MTDSTKTNHHFGEFIFLGALILITLVVYNLWAWSKVDTDSETQAATQTDAMATQEMPTDFQGFVQLGNDFMDRGIWDHAIRQYEQAVAIDSTNADVYVDLGACYHAQGDFDDAFKSLKHALRIKPNHPIALFNLGIVELSRADTTAAKQYWNDYVNVAGDTPQANMVRQQLDQM